jgi:hypothetical protein
MKTNELKRIFEENGFNVSINNEEVDAGAEIQTYTNEGVEMNIWLNPFSIDSFVNYVDEFDIDEQIDLHREEDGSYKSAFTIKQSLEDFTEFHNHLKNVASSLENLQIYFQILEIK